MAVADNGRGRVWNERNRLFADKKFQQDHLDDAGPVSVTRNRNLITFIILLGALIVGGISAWYVQARPCLTRKQKAAALLVSIDIGGSAGCFIFSVVNLLMRLTIGTGTITFLALVILAAFLTLLASIVVSRIIPRRPVMKGRAVALWGMLLSGTGLFAVVSMAVTLLLPTFVRFSWLLTYVIVAVPLVVLSGIFALSCAVWFLTFVPTRLLLLIAFIPVAMFLVLVSVFVILIS